MVETIFDTLNAKAALFAIEELYDDHPEYIRLPLIVSVLLLYLVFHQHQGEK